MSSENAVKKACNCHVSPTVRMRRICMAGTFSGFWVCNSVAALRFMVNFAYLFIELNVHWFKLLLDVTSSMLVLGLGEGHALWGFLRFVVADWGLWHSVE